MWTPIYGDCNAEFYFAADAWVRCTGVEGHGGLHRGHYDTGPQKAMLMWGDEKRDTDLDSLVGTDPLRLQRGGAMTLLRQEHCGREEAHPGHNGRYVHHLAGPGPHLYCDGDLEHLRRQREREANPPPGPVDPPRRIEWS